MIFITVGTQLPFDRMINDVIKAVMKSNFKRHKISIQAVSIQEIIENPLDIECVEKLSECEFEKLFNECDILISHAGMGTIIKTIECKKSIIVVPRLKRYKEHRNNHQVDTCSALVGRFSNIHFANNDAEILDSINSIANQETKGSSNLWQENRQEALMNLKNNVGLLLKDE